ncbi:putative reverse transcriptase domain-containing protein, partial [Tanacetum coccineum]
MDLMNHVCKPYLDMFVIVFIDDILIYSKNKKEHEEHLKTILQLHKKEKFKGVHVDPARIEAIKNWAAPTMPTEPLTKLTQKNKKYEWGEEEEEAFQMLKQILCSAPILALPDRTEDFVVYFGASMKGFGAFLIQQEKVIAHASRQLKT